MRLITSVLLGGFASIAFATSGLAQELPSEAKFSITYTSVNPGSV